MLISEKCDVIVIKLLKLQDELINLQKDGKNPHFKSTYVTLPALLEEVKPRLSAEHLLLTQALHGETVVTRITDVTGQFIASEYPVKASKQDAQGFMAGVTYARRGGLMALLALGAEDDDGNMAVGRDVSPKEPAKRLPPAIGNDSSPQSGPLKGFVPPLKNRQLIEQGETTGETDEHPWASYIIPFGKHQGKRLDQVDRAMLAQSLKWAKEQTTQSPSLRTYIEAVSNYLY